MKWFHLIFGIALFFVFTTTGSYMRADFPDKDAIPQDLRLLMRSRHIYILFAALMHLCLGVYVQLRPILLQKIIQITASSVLTLASIMLVYAWYIETYDLQHFSNTSRYGIYLSLTAVVLHVIGGFRVEPPTEAGDKTKEA
jgi:hypothetical protein